MFKYSFIFAAEIKADATAKSEAGSKILSLCVAY